MFDLCSNSGKQKNKLILICRGDFQYTDVKAQKMISKNRSLFSSPRPIEKMKSFSVQFQI